MNKSISIITVNYNNDFGLKKTIESVLLQKNIQFEYLIIDGASNDRSIEIIRQYSKKINYWISESDTGVYNAMNKGIVKATGDYLIFLNSGDCLIDQCVLKKCFDNISSDSSVDIWYGDMLVESRIGFEPYIHKHPAELEITYFKDDTINHQACLIKRDLFLEIGLYPEYYNLASDYWFFLMSLIKDKKYRYLDFPMVVYDFNGVSASDNFKNYKNEQYIIWNKIIPIYVKNMIIKNEIIIKNNHEMQNTLNYGFVRLGIIINKLYQKIK